jgi:hypothetical protein
LKGRAFSRAAKRALSTPVIPTRERSPSGCHPEQASFAQRRT